MTMPDEIFVSSKWDAYTIDQDMTGLTFDKYHHDRIVTALREENERLREALRFYGDKNNSKKHDGYVLGNWIEINGVLLFDPDNGQRAREALGEKNDPQ